MGNYREIDSPVQMRLYTLTKYQFVLVFVGFLVAFLMMFLIGILGPSAIVNNVKTAKDLGVPPKNFLTGPFVLNSGMLTHFNQELWLFCQFQLTGFAPNSKYKFERKFNISAQLMGITKDTSYKSVTHTFQNITNLLTCDINSCNSIVLYHLGTLDYSSYSGKIFFYGLHLPRSIKVRNVIFSFRYFEDQFTQMQIWFRFAFLVLSFTVTCLYMHSLRRFPVHDWCIEQKWLSALLPLLLLYNDPLFPLNFLISSWVPSCFDIIFQASFLAAILMFWLCAFHGIGQSERHLIPFYLPKFIMIGIIWVTLCTLLGWQRYNELLDPLFKVDVKHFIGLKLFFSVVMLIYVIYLIILIVKAFKDLTSVPFFDIRLKFLTILMSMVMLIGLSLVFVRFGLVVFQNDFLMDISLNYHNSTEFLTSYGLFNIYIFTMAFIYSPSAIAIKEASMWSLSFSAPNENEDDTLFQRKSTYEAMYKEIK
ncbi:transmembrane protein 181-like isoform X2 [Hydra vulgaris]|uniref:Transmembrane protein 181-like isoform X2 n=1 Tax=Hydra vulgaris TaxID=6087 RepID=A0ABM4BW57_HYDVU